MERNAKDESRPLLDVPTLVGENHTKSNYNPLSVFMIFFFPSLGGLLFGYDIGSTSAVLSQLEDSTYAGVIWTNTVADSTFLQGVITSIGVFGALLGSTTCFIVGDTLGRRRSLLVAGFFFFLGSSIEVISGNSSWDASRGISTLLIGRCTYGYACGFAMHGAPAYIGEMSPAAIRGTLVSLKEAFIVLGMVLGYSIGYAYSEKVGGWRYTYGWSMPFAVLLFAGMSYLPYSARWLALKGRMNEARQSMKFVTPDVPESEIDAVREAAQKAAASQSTGSLQLLLSPRIFPALVAGVGLVILQQITGQPSVLYYADTIFDDVGLSKMASIGISLFKLIMTLFSTVLVDKYGRKLLLFVGCSLMLVALIILGSAFIFDYMGEDDCNLITTDSSCPAKCLWDSSCGNNCTISGYSSDDCTCCGVGGMDLQRTTILTSLFIYIGGYQVGFGPISWLIISEIFPLEVRGRAVSIAVVNNFFWNTVMSFLFPTEIEYIGSVATFYIYAVILSFGIYFIYSRVPETKGMSLEDIENYFLRKSHSESNDNMCNKILI